MNVTLKQAHLIGPHAWLAVGVAALGAFLLAGCRAPKDGDSQASREKIEASAKAAKSQGADVSNAVLKNSSFSGSDDAGRPLWSIGAREIRVAQDAGSGESVPGLAPRRAVLSQAWAKLYRNGKLESSLTSPRLNFAQTPKGDEITLLGDGKRDVAARSQGALRPDIGAVVLRAPRVEIAPKTRQLLAPQGAHAFSALRGATVSARRVGADTDLGALRLLGDVRASGPQGSLRADAGTWNWKTGRALATGNVSATNGKATINGARLNADIDAKRGIVVGTPNLPVSARSDGGTATAPTVSFDWRANSIAASGGVQLSRDGAVLRAPKLQTDAGFSRSTASGGVSLSKDGATFSARTIQTFDKLARATATGSVKLSRDGATLTAARVDARNNLAIATASGNVKLSREGAILTASRLEARDNFQTATASGNVRVQREDITLSADTATARNLREAAQTSIEAQGGVRAVSRNGTVRAQSATWNGGRSGQITASGGVSMAREGTTLSAPRGVAQLQNAQLRGGTLSGGVRGQLPDGTRISAQSATYNAQLARVAAHGGVTALRPNATLRAGSLQALLNENVLLLSDGVRVTTTDGVTVTSQGARYDKRRDVLTTSGAVYFSDAKRGLRGTGRALTITNFSKPTRRAVLDNSLLTAPNGALGGLKIF